MKGIDEDRVSAWFESEIEAAELPLEFELITGGHSNLTYKVTDAAGERYVLRRPPTGAVIATAHDMAREFRIISAVARTRVPVPPVVGLCQDESVNGAPFYVMTFVEGVILEDRDMTVKLFDLGQRRKTGSAVIEALAELHRVDPDHVGLGDLGRREAYLARQLKRWRTQWEKTKTRELPAMDESYRALESEMPEQAGAGIVHGDYRLGNMLVAASGDIAAVLDWELCTLGDPMADLGYVMNTWADPGDEGLAMRGTVTPPTVAEGFPSREEFLARYVELTGRDVSKIDYYRAFQYWRLAAIIEGVLARYEKGVMGGSTNTEVFRAQVDGLAAAAVERIRDLKNS
jgi:aminoglycoside phosphotransferase (APT) family kinase protein